MRFDMVFYVVGTLCFISATLVIPILGVTLVPTAYVIVLLLFGLFFFASGYSARPRKYRITTLKPHETRDSEQKLKEEPIQQTREPIRPSFELTKIRGIGPKRMAQLNSLQITSVEDLVHFSAEDLANKLKISSKITAKWIAQAKDMLK